jgi:hypothetical protein
MAVSSKISCYVQRRVFVMLLFPLLRHFKNLMKADAIPIWATRQGNLDSAISRLFPELPPVQ